MCEAASPGVLTHKRHLCVTDDAARLVGHDTGEAAVSIWAIAAPARTPMTNNSCLIRTAVCLVFRISLRSAWPESVPDATVRRGFRARLQRHDPGPRIAVR